MIFGFFSQESHVQFSTLGRPIKKYGLNTGTRNNFNFLISKLLEFKFQILNSVLLLADAQANPDYE